MNHRTCWRISGLALGLLLITGGTGPRLLSADVPASAAAVTPLDPMQFQTEEDRIDRLPPGEQGPALLELRKKLAGANTPGEQAIRQRLGLKLALAEQRAAAAPLPEEPPYAERLGWSRQAAEIGATYLKQNDPARALAWEAHSRAFAAESLWPDQLRNTVHGWHEARLRGLIDAKNWPGAREELSAWKARMSGDAAVADGINLYAQARAADLLTALETGDPRTVLSNLTAEEKENPGAPAWQLVRDRTAAALDHAFQQGVARRDIGAAKSALEMQTAIASEYQFDAKRAPIFSNTQQFERLVRDLQPSPIQREFGQVHAVQFRIEVMQTIGMVAYRHGNLSFNAFSWFPYAVGDWRIYHGENEPTWFGFNMTGLGNGTGKNFQSANRFQSQFFFLFGRRGQTWSGSLGVGGIYNALNFSDGIAQVSSASTTVAAGLRGDFEQICGERWTLYGTMILGKGANVGTWELKAGWRYYFNHHFSVGAHLMLSEITVGRDGIVSSFHASQRMIGPTMMMQF